MTTQITLGWKQAGDKFFIAIAIQPHEGDEWMEFTSGREWTDLDALKVELNHLATAMFPTAMAQGVTVQ